MIFESVVSNSNDIIPVVHASINKMRTYPKRAYSNLLKYFPQNSKDAVNNTTTVVAPAASFSYLA